ncbi:molybdopterin-guanine dinucleotide biosynthesis protein B [bacterium]|nr:molybdopterin-guanine dinucleotide biosynthesis protein B [bacterium]
MPVVISIVGKSDSGKTTLLEKLLPEIRKRGYRVGTIKHHAHGFDLDHEGKDSWRHKRAGSQAVALSSPAGFALIKDLEQELTIDEIVENCLADMDIVLTEGYKKEGKPKIEIFRKDGPHKDILCKDDKTLIAMVTDMEMRIPVPCFGLEDTVQLADFLEKRYLRDK